MADNDYPDADSIGGTYFRRARILSSPPYDEIGTPASKLETCDCGVTFRVEEEHNCRDAGEWIDWEEYQRRQADETEVSPAP